MPFAPIVQLQISPGQIMDVQAMIVEVWLITPLISLTFWVHNSLRWRTFVCSILPAMETLPRTIRKIRPMCSSYKIKKLSLVNTQKKLG